MPWQGAPHERKGLGALHPDTPPVSCSGFLAGDVPGCSLDTPAGQESGREPSSSSPHCQGALASSLLT